VPKTNQKESVTRFFNAIHKHPRSSLYILCDQLLTPSESAREEIYDIAQNISPEQLRRVIAKMTNIETNERALQDKITLDAFTQLKARLLCDEVWLNHLEPQDIIALSANDEFYLHGFIALIRRHAKAQGHADPFCQFDFAILQNAGAEHIAAEISDVTAKAETLPLENFKMLAKGDIGLARSVLTLLQSHPVRFEMGEYFLTQHKELKDEIYANWHKTKGSIALTSSSEADLTESVKITAQKHPEFSVILKTDRIKRDLPDTKNARKRDYSFMGLTGFGTLCMTASLVPKLGGAVLASTKAALAGQACVAGLAAVASPLVAPTSIALFMGGVTYLARHGVEESGEGKNKEELNSPSWALTPFKIKWGS
jgi:hypothetical protein